MSEKKDPPDHIYDGMVFAGAFPASSLDAIKQTQFHDDDIIISTYPKCGKLLYSYILHFLNDMSTCNTFHFGHLSLTNV